MVCPICGVDRNFVVDKRSCKDTAGNDVTVRTRECTNCHQKFKTKEIMIDTGKKSREILDK